MSTSALLQSAQDAFADCLAGVSIQAKAKESFLDAGTIAEFLLCFPHEPLLRPFESELATAALGWLREGLLERAYVHSAQNEQAAIMLFSLAQRSPQFREDDGATLKALVESGVIGRSEMPMTWNAMMRARLLTAGIELASAYPTAIQLSKNVDRRLLRAHTDSYDLNSLLAVAQIAGLGILERADLPTRFATVFVLNAAAKGHSSWLCLAALLGTDYFGMSSAIFRMAQERATALVSEQTGLLPGPPDSDKLDDQARISGCGVLVRGTLAYLCLIERDALC